MKMNHASAGSARHRQRGAAAVFVAVFITALIAVLLLVLDIGRLYYAQRQLESEANMAALAGAQIVSGCSGSNPGTPGDLAAVTTAVLQSLNDNRGTVGGIADLGPPANLLSTGIGGSPAVELGETVVASDGVTRTFKPLTAGDPNIDSVRVNLSAPQPASFLMSFFSSSNSGRRLYASATAKQAAVGSFYLGTGVANLSGGLLNQLLGGLLCAPGDTACQNSVIALNVASSSAGLAKVGVSLGQLSTALGVSVKDLSDPLTLATQTPVLSKVLNGLASSLGSTASASVTGLLSNLASAVSGNTQQIPLGQLLGAVDGIASNVPFIDLQSLILALGTASQAGTGGQVQPIQLPVNLNVPGVAQVYSFLKIGAPPQLGGPGPAGQTTAKTAEATVMIRISAGTLLNSLLGAVQSLLNGLLNAVGSLLGINTSVSLLSSNLNLGVDVAVAPATASLDTLTCPTATSSPVAGLSTDTAIATVTVGSFSGSAASAPALDTTQTNIPLVEAKIDATHLLLGLANLGSTDVKFSLGLTGVGVGGTGSQNLAPVDRFSVISQAGSSPPNYFLADGAPTSGKTATDNPQTLGSPVSVGLTLGLNETQTGSGLVGALSNLVANLISGVKLLVQPLISLVNGLATAIINPLLQTLGIQLGASTVTMNTASFNQPTIQTNCLPGVSVNNNGCPAAP